jgi:hypothetical protein
LWGGESEKSAAPDDLDEVAAAAARRLALVAVVVDNVEVALDAVLDTVPAGVKEEGYAAHGRSWKAREEEDECILLWLDQSRQSTERGHQEMQDSDATLRLILIVPLVMATTTEK